MGKIILVLALLLTIAGVIFGAFIYPLWTLIHCAISKSRSTKSKTIWIILMILTWPITSFVYGLFSAKRRLFQWISAILIFALVFLVTAFFYMTIKMGELTSAQISKTISKIDQIDTAGITPQGLTKLKEGLSVLKGEMKFKLSGLEKMNKAASLMQLFDIIDRDNKITASEYKDWMDKFESREMLDRKALEQYIRNFKAGQN